MNPHGLSIRERAEALISVAHPDFRAELTRERGSSRFLRLEPAARFQRFTRFRYDGQVVLSPGAHGVRVGLRPLQCCARSRRRHSGANRLCSGDTDPGILGSAGVRRWAQHRLDGAIPVTADKQVRPAAIFHNQEVQ